MERIVASRSALLNALTTVEKAVGKKSSLAVLRGVMFDCFGEKCTITATDLEISIATTIDIEEESELVFIVPFEVLKGLVSNLSSDTVVLLYEEDGFELQVNTETSKNSVKCFGDEMFPEQSPMENSVKAKVSSKLLADISRLVAFSASSDEARMNLNGVHLEVSGGEAGEILYATSTDGYRVSSMWKVISEEASEQKAKVIVPTESVVAWGKVFENEMDAEIELEISSNFVSAKSAKTVSVTATLDGIFPDVRDYVDKIEAGSVTVEVNRKDFTDACKMAKIFAAEGDNVLLFEFGAEGQLMPTVSAKSDQTGNSVNMFAATHRENGKVKLNAGYLFDYLKLNYSEEIRMKANLKNPAPVVFSHKDGYSYLMMPVV